MKKNYFPCRRFYWASWRHKEGPQGLDQANTKLDREFGPKQCQIMRETQSQGAVWKTINCKWFSANCKYRPQIGCFGPPIDGLKWTKIQQKMHQDGFQDIRRSWWDLLHQMVSHMGPTAANIWRCLGHPANWELQILIYIFAVFYHFFQC